MSARRLLGFDPRIPFLSYPTPRVSSSIVFLPIALSWCHIIFSRLVVEMEGRLRLAVAAAMRETTEARSAVCRLLRRLFVSLDFSPRKALTLTTPSPPSPIRTHVSDNRGRARTYTQTRDLLRGRTGGRRITPSPPRQLLAVSLALSLSLRVTQAQPPPERWKQTRVGLLPLGRQATGGRVKHERERERERERGRQTEKRSPPPASL